MRITGSIARTIRSINATDEVVKPQMTAYLAVHGDAPFDRDVAEWMVRQMSTPPRVRSGSFSGSASGSCERLQVLNYLGLSTVGMTEPQLQAIYDDGKFRHLRLQAQMLQAGIIERAELPLPWKRMRAMGTADGVGVVPLDHPRVSWRGLTFGLEIKGANSRQYKIITDEGPERYLRQVHRYFLTGGFDLFVIFVENKDSQAWQEMVFEPDQNLLDEQRAELHDLNHAVNTKTLPPLLPGCAKLKGSDFRACAQGTQAGWCAKLRQKSWPVIGQTGTSASSRSVKVSPP